MVTHADEIAQNDNADKRYLPRWGTNIQASWKKANDRQTQGGILKNLGCGGACISVDAPITLNETVHLTINLPWEPSIQVSGTVCWVGKEDDQKLAGIHFLNISSTFQDAILHHMRETENVNLADLWFKDWK